MNGKKDRVLQEFASFLQNKSTDKSELTIVDQEELKCKSVFRKAFLLGIIQSVITFMADEPVLLAALDSRILDSRQLV